jgi:predicted nucleotidyltransferase
MTRAEIIAALALKLFLEDRLGRKTDLTTERAIRPELRHTIERDAIRVA